MKQGRKTRKEELVVNLASGEAVALSYTRSQRRAQSAWGRMVDIHGERGAFRHLSAHVGGSDAAFRTLSKHQIGTDLI